MNSQDYQPRFNWDQVQQAVPDVVNGLRSAGVAIDHSGLDRMLIEMVKVRASQINGCVYCVQFHLNKARQLRTPQVKLDMLPVWRDVDLFSAAERAALAWTEALTQMASHHVDDDVYASVKQHFNENELANLTAAIGLINAWNRIVGALRVPPPPPIEG